MYRRIISKVVGLVLGESVPHRHKSTTRQWDLHNEIRWREAEAQSVRKQNCHVCCVSHLQQQVLANRSYTVPSTIRATQYPNCHKTPRHPPPPPTFTSVHHLWTSCLFLLVLELREIHSQLTEIKKPFDLLPRSNLSLPALSTTFDLTLDETICAPPPSSKDEHSCWANIISLLEPAVFRAALPCSFSFTPDTYRPNGVSTTFIRFSPLRLPIHTNIPHVPNPFLHLFLISSSKVTLSLHSLSFLVRSCQSFVFCLPFTTYKKNPHSFLRVFLSG